MKVIHGYRQKKYKLVSLGSHVYFSGWALLHWSYNANNLKTRSSMVKIMCIWDQLTRKYVAEVLQTPFVPNLCAEGTIKVATQRPV